MKQTWNRETGRWEPQTNGDYIRNLNDEKLANFIAKTFCNGYCEGYILEWLKKERKD